MQHHEKIQILELITSENELRTELVIPLLKKMKHFSDVLDNQGADEAGVDVIGISTSPFKKAEYTAFILKKGDITLKVADQKNNLINIIETQIRTAIKHPLTHPSLPSEKLYANRVIVVSNGNISKNALVALKKAFLERSDISLDFIGHERLIDQIDDLWPRFYEDRRPFLSSYAQKLYSSLNIVNFEEFGFTNRERSLSDIYIDSVLYEVDSVSSNDFVFDKDPISGEKLCNQKAKLMVVTSGPGGGKTTLLKEIAISESKNNKDCVAVYLHARDIHQSRDLVRTASEVLSQLSKDTAEEVYGELNPEKLLFLVDGLDELASHDDRVTVIKRLSDANKESGTRVVIGTRPETSSAIVTALSNYKAFSISPLRKSQIRSFFGKWFQGNVDKAGKLMIALEDKGIFDKLPRTPMTMTLVAIVYESKEDIPSSLTGLYEMFVDLLTGKWDANRNISSAFDSPIKVAFLNRLARVMHSERLETISQDRCIELAAQFFKEQATIANIDAKAFIQSIIDRSNIVIPTGSDQLRFSHMTFQEYFCAENLFQDFPSISSILSWYGDDWWREVLFFLAGKKQDISQIVDHLMAADYSDSDTRSTKLLTLGSLLQAGYLTTAQKKKSVIRFSAEKYFECYDDYREWIDQGVSEKVKRRFSRAMLVDMVQDLFSSNFSSAYLLIALEETYAELPQDKENESARFLIACTLAKLRKYEPILEFATNPAMIDTSMFLISGTLLNKQELSDTEKEKLKRLKKRLTSFRESVHRETRGGLPKGTKKIPKK